MCHQVGHNSSTCSRRREGIADEPQQDGSEREAQPANQGRWPNSRSQDATEARLGHWFRAQRMRMRRGALTQERIAILDGQLPGWNHDSWIDMLETLVQWRAQPGHQETWPAQQATDDLERRIGRWLANQRMQFRRHQEGGHSNLTQERIDILDGQLPGWRPEQ